MATLISDRDILQDRVKETIKILEHEVAFMEHLERRGLSSFGARVHLMSAEVEARLLIKEIKDLGTLDGGSWHSLCIYKEEQIEKERGRK